MNTQNNKSASGRKTSQSRAKTTRRASRPAAKKPTTIDLEAKDVTPPTPKDAKPTEMAARDTVSKATPKVDPKPTATKPADAPKSAKTDAPKPSPFGRDGNPEPSQKKEDEAPSKPQSGSGFGKMAAAGIFGGLVTLGGAAGMQFAGMLPNLGQSPVVEQSAPIVDIKPVEAEVAQLRERLDNLPTPTSETSVDLSPLEQRLSALENAPKPTTGPDGEVENAQLADLNEKIAALEAALAAKSETSASANNTAITDLTDRLEGVERATAPMQETITKLGEAQQGTTNLITALTQKMDVFSNSLTTDIEERIGKFEKKLETAATGEKLARSVAVNALKASMERGEPFSAALTSLETLQGPSALIDSLKAHASNGVATNKMLREDFHAIERTIVAASSQTNDTGVVDRLMSSVSSLVTVRSDTPQAGNTPKAIVSRIDANLKSGELSGALNEWNSLPQTAKSVSAAWSQKLKSRMEADQNFSELLQSIQAAG